MKVSFITMHAVYNYGSVLQAYATQEILKKFFDEVEVINYKREDVKPENLMNSLAKNSFIKKIIMFPTIKRWIKVFDSFRNKYLNLSENEYTYNEDFIKYPLVADAFCTGSDQVWNSKWNNGYILPLYLNFVPDNKIKFSFASSFGQSKLSENEVKETYKYIQKYDFISVREDSGLDILNNQYMYKNAIHVLDPTLILDGIFWKEKTSIRKIKKKYILIYNLNRSKEFDSYAKKMAKKTGYKLVRFCTRYDQCFRCGKSMIIPEIFDFINLISNAEYVLTDSFHATAFSLNLNVHPICICPKKFGGRIDSILKLTHTECCKVTNYNDLEVLKSEINFDRVNQILDFERKKALNYLDLVVQSVKSKS